MATVLTKPQANAAKVEAKLSHELAQATSRIRWTDLLGGGLTLLVLVLGYTLAAVLADKLIDLPAWARTGGLGVLLVVLGVAGWFNVVRPLRSRINPRFAARQVEHTLADGKNAIINWVDLKAQDLPESVRAAVGARAAEGVADAEVARVGESRRVLVLLAAVGALVAGLAVFFLLVKSAPFFSLLNRAYNPFSATGIATRTAITLDEPAGGDATVTSGDSLTVRVTLAGTLPDAQSPDRPRLLVRYNPDAEEFDELPLDAAGSKREFALLLPPSVIQNGFRYAVAAGDARTPEYAVAVRTRPLLRDFTVRYAYPAYTRLLPEVTTDPRVEGYRGTQVTLTARANRGVKDARLVFDTQLTQVPGEVSPESPDAVRFRFTLDEACNYRVAWTASDGETAESPAYPVRLLTDQPPVVAITAPADEEASLPADGLLKVDGVAADDFGLVGLTLRLRVAGTPPIALEPKKYRNGEAFRRAGGEVAPTALEYKDSVKLSALKSKSGEAVKLAPDTVVEYWLEATDNCTVPAAQVGRSKVQRVKIAPPPPPAEAKARQDQQQRDQGERQQQEQNAQAQQDQQPGQGEKPPQQPRPDNVEKPANAAKPPEGDPTGGEPNQGSKPQPDQAKGDQPQKGTPKGDQPKGSGEPMANPDQPPTPPEPGKTADDGSKPSDPANGAKPPDNSSKPKKSGGKSGDQTLQDQADKVQQELNEQQRQGGETRPPEANPKTDGQPPAEQSATKPGQPKPQAGDAQQPGKAGEPKPQPGQDAGAKPDATPAQDKPSGKTQEGKTEPSTTKTNSEPKSGDTGDPQQKPKAVEGKTEPSQPKGGQPGETKPGQEKPTPAEANPKSEGGGQGPDAKPEPKEEPRAGEGRKPDAGTPNGSKPKGADTPQPGAPKGDGKPQSGEKPGQPDAKAGEAPKPKDGDAPQARAGEGKPEKPTSPGAAKPTPQDPATGGQPQAPKPDEVKPPMGEGAGEAKPAAEPKADPTAKPTGANATPKGTEKGTQKGADKPSPGAGGPGEKKMDAKEIEQAVKDLKSGDPAKEQAARDKLDKAMGKGNREAAEKKAEQLERDLKSGDKTKQAAARKEIEEFAKQAEQNGAGGKDDPTAPKGKGEGKTPTAEQVKEAQQLAEDLTSKNDAKREAAEKKFDDAMGKGQREKLQQDLKDAQSGDPQKADAAKKRLEEMAKGKPGDKSKGAPRGPGDRPDTPGDKLADDAANRRKTADLQLKPFEEAKRDLNLQKKLGYTPEQYDEFLKGYRDMVQRQADAAAQPELLPVPNEAGGPTTIKVGGGTGTQPLVKKPDGPGTAGGSIGTAPPGYSDAQRKFAEEAAKLRKPEPKK